jgi:hypothetical protein
MIENLKAIQVISTFTSADCKDFKKFLQSPFHNSRKNLVDLFSFIQKNDNNWAHPNFTYENIFKLLHPKEDFDKAAVTKAFSALYKLLESYILVKKSLSDELSKNIQLLGYYNQYNLEELYKDKERELEKDFRDSIKSSDYLTHLLFEIEKCSYASTKDKRIGDINYQNASYKLDTFFFYTKLKLVCLMLNRSLIVAIKYDYQLLEHTINQELVARLNSKVIHLYYYAYQLLSQPKSAALYEKLKYELMIHGNELEKTDLSLLYTFLENCTSSVYTNTKAFYTNLFDIYLQQIQNKTIYYFDHLHRSVLKNIIKVALKLEKNDWAELFLKTHRDLIIPEQNAEEIYFFCLSEIYFSQKKYDDTLLSLAKVKPDDIFIKLSLKRMYLKIYYEKGEFNALDSSINSYRVYLSRENSIPDEKLKKEKVFVNTIQRMMKLKLERREAEFQVFWKKISVESMVDKQWIEEKLRFPTLTTD